MIIGFGVDDVVVLLLQKIAVVVDTIAVVAVVVIAVVWMVRNVHFSMGVTISISMNKNTIPIGLAFPDLSIGMDAPWFEVSHAFIKFDRGLDAIAIADGCKAELFLKSRSGGF